MDIRLEEITKVFGTDDSRTVAVDKISLEIASGELFFLLGPSGCGKTTLLRMIAGLTAPTGGKVYFASRDVTDMPVEKRNTAMVFQNYALWPHMSVLENVEFGPKMRGATRVRRRELAGEHLARVQMDGYMKRRPNQLSGGQQQRVALARALAAEADCVLLDEPLSNLDARLRIHMRSELRRLIKSSGTTGVYVTHDQTEALSMADRVAVMDAGRIAQIAAPEQLYNRPATRFVADFLGEANFVDGRVARSGTPAKIDTPLGPVLAGGGEQLEPGTEVTCCIRPERITIAVGPAPPTAGNEFTLPAKIKSSVYLGDIRQYVCIVGDGMQWKVSVIGGAPAIDQDTPQVTLRIAADDVTVLRR